MGNIVQICSKHSGNGTTSISDCIEFNGIGNIEKESCSISYGFRGKKLKNAKIGKELVCLKKKNV